MFDEATAPGPADGQFPESLSGSPFAERAVTSCSLASVLAASPQGGLPPGCRVESLFNVWAFASGRDPLALGVWVAGLITWRVLEAIVDIRSSARLRGGVQRQDRGSRLVLVCLIVVGTLVGVVAGLKVPATAITGAPEFFVWLGALLLYAGIALRLYAIAVLGAFFTTAVAVAPGQVVVERGPYRRIRHPAYTGLLLILLGLSLGLANWLSVVVIMGCALVGLTYRIRVEETALQEHLGQGYREYMGRTKRLIPFVL